ncbi:hypothetical protein L0337_03630 [candidate division KSB1 bacterium]|nr:hypothetical protein [candidate division KSB1 bacterium]
MIADFLYTTLGNTGVKVCRLGLSASYRPGRKTVYKALDEGPSHDFDMDFMRKFGDVVHAANHWFM